VTLADGGVSSTVFGSGTTVATSDVISNVANFTAGSGADNITGNSAANVIIGNAGADQLNGGLGNDTIDGGAGADIIQGQDGDDTLLGGADNDTILGGIGNDSLTGGLGIDQLIGGAGVDTFKFTTIADAPVLPVATAERVHDFITGTDKLDFSAIDAIAATPATNDAFSFNTTSGAPLTAAGDLRFQQVAPDTVIQANVGLANGVATDMTVALAGVTPIQTADLVL
jgi:Ca2+-binding RTX toxin-like protein